MRRLRIMWFWVTLPAMLLALLILAGDRARAVQATAAVDPRIWDDIARNGSAGFLVVLRNQPNVTQAAAVPDRTARGQAVVNALRSAANATQPPVRSELDRLGARSRAYWVVNMLAVEGGRDTVTAMAARPDVLALETNRPYRAQLEQPADPAAAATPNATSAPNAVEWNVTKVGAPALWAKGVTGQGRIYANADTGVQWDHPALKPQYAGWNGSTPNHNYAWWDAVREDLGGPMGNARCGFTAPAPCDDNGHGTHTTGTAVGDDGAGQQIGVAPGAKWIACRNMEDGWGKPSTYIECLQFFLAPTDLNGNNPDPSRRPDAVGNSYGCPPVEGCAPTALSAAVNSVRAAGIFMAVSAGNSGPTCSSVNDPPGLDDASITVGSTDINDTIAGSSSRGPVTVDGSGRRKPDISAPGVNVRSAYPYSASGYGSLSGTSMAAPHVGAAVVLLWSALPHLRGQVDATEALLQQTALPRTSAQGCGGDGPTQVPNNVYGHGRLDIAAAFSRLTVHGTVTLEGWAGPAAAGFSTATVQLDGGMPVQVADGGGFYLDLNGVNAGSHTLTVCAPGYLCATRPILTGAGVSQEQPGPVQLPAGMVTVDDVVNLHDVTALLASFGQTPPNHLDGLGRRVDVNGDGIVDIKDVVLVVGNFGRRSPVPWP